MDFNNYYQNQAEGKFFKGIAVQKGYGLGGVFRRFFSWFVPILKENALPVVKSVGKEVIQGIANIATDTINGENIEESSKNRLKETFQKINQAGKGYKKKRNLKKLKNKFKKPKLLDIFN